MYLKSPFFFFQVKEKHQNFIAAWTEIVIIVEEGNPQGSLEEWVGLTPGNVVDPTGDPPSLEVQVIDVLENVMYQWILGTSLRLLTIARLHALTDVRGRLVSVFQNFPFFSECYSWARCITSKLLEKVHNNKLGTFMLLLSTSVTLQTDKWLNDSKLYTYWCNTYDLIDTFLYYWSKPLMLKNNALGFPSQSAYFMKNAASYWSHDKIFFKVHLYF